MKILLDKIHFTKSFLSWIDMLSLFIMTPGNAINGWHPTASRIYTTILISMRTWRSIMIFWGSTNFNITLTKPGFTRVSIIRLWATVWTFYIARAIDGTFIMIYPAIPHALSIVITSANTFINLGITDMFAFQFIFWITKNSLYIAVRNPQTITGRSKSPA